MSPFYSLTKSFRLCQRGEYTSLDASMCACGPHFDTRFVRSVFCDAHVAAENLLKFIFSLRRKNSARLYLLFYKKKGSTLRCCLGFLIKRSVVALVFVLAGGLRLFAALYAGALIVLFLSQIGKNAGLCAAALKSFQSVIQRLVFLDVDFRHVFPSLQIRLAALQGPMNWLLTLILYRFTRQMSIITLQV